MYLKNDLADIPSLHYLSISLLSPPPSRCSLDPPRLRGWLAWPTVRGMTSCFRTLILIRTATSAARRLRASSFRADSRKWCSRTYGEGTWRGGLALADAVRGGPMLFETITNGPLLCRDRRTSIIYSSRRGSIGLYRFWW